MTDYGSLINVFNKYTFDYVIHLASFKSVPDSLKFPLDYYINNLYSTLNLLKCMSYYNCFNLIFSSSACVYGNTDICPITEETPTLGKQTNPYGTTKIFIEKILYDLCLSNKKFKIIILRYFNPVGAHSSCCIGDEVRDNIPKNLFLIIQEIYKNNIINNEKKFLYIFGNDYDTKDGTCIRDFIHIEDIANAHVKSIEYFDKLNVSNNFEIFNIGTGTGYTVLEVINLFNKFTNNSINYIITDRRPGDIPISYTNNNKARLLLNWYPKFNIEDMVKSTINWSNKSINYYL
jgi:UDP-glucose 4-epimerase